MPVEAIHISAFLDALAASRAPAFLRVGELRELGRLGSLVIDWPYFERFPLGVARYLLNRPTAQSRWGEALHKGKPVGAAMHMMARAQLLRDRGEPAARRVLALALGFLSHLAVDRSLHPLVNRMARERARRLGSDAAREHTEVEKFHSVLFHERRNGFDFMGTAALRAHIEVDADAALRDPELLATLDGAFRAATGEAPGRSNLNAWARGYCQYVWLVSSPAGKAIVPARVKRQVHGELYRGAFGSFEDAYGQAVAAARQALDAALLWYAAPASDPRARQVFARAFPEGPIDLG